MAFDSSSGPARKLSLSSGDEEDDVTFSCQENDSPKNNGGDSDRSLIQPGKVLKSSNNANITPTARISLGVNNNNVSPSPSFPPEIYETPQSTVPLEEELDGGKLLFGGGYDMEKSIFKEFGRNADKAGRTTMNTMSTPLSTPKKSRAQPVLSVYRDMHDLTKLEYITMENVLECLRERYRTHQYYTYAGPVLLSLNSCLRLSRASLIEDITKMTWYTIDEAKKPQKENDSGMELAKKSPHVYDIGYQCLRNLLTVGSHQIILISGESGAGKTTATQQLIKYLTENNSRNFGANICSNLDKKIFFATIILESFGNAKTQANPNSSRFGRLVQLNYRKSSGQIMGAEVQTYLLDKHRVAKYDYRCERNFHIFYYVLHGLKYGTIQAPSVNFKNAVGILQHHFLNDAMECEDEEVQRLVNAVHAIDMSSFTEIVHMILSLMALLNVVFVPDCDTPSEEEYYSSGLESPYKTEFIVSDRNCVRLAADLMGISDSELVDILIARKITAGGAHRHSIFRKPCESIRECEERLHALTSFIYDRIFSYVLDHLNSSLKGDSVHQDGSLCTLSLLDLYGFENFHSNHLEQICISYANERLQQINISIVKSYYEQSIPPDEIMIPPTELIRIESELYQRIDELHAHVFAFLDEECLLKRSSEDKDILERMHVNLVAKKSNFIKTSKPHEPGYKFTVAHYATKVEYQLSGLVQKNKDHIPPEFQDVLRSSTNSFVNNLFKNDLIRSRNISGATPRSVHTLSTNNKNARGKTILTRFKQSVEELMGRLKATEDRDVHFVRCIRPNQDLLAGTFSMDVVEKQLHACGIADVVKIAGNGYPIRLYCAKFMTEFPKVLSYFCNGNVNTKLLTLIFATSKSNSLKFGKTMVFMSEKCWAMFKKTENFLNLHNARIIQNAWKEHLEQKELLKRTILSLSSSTIHSVQVNGSSMRLSCIDEIEDWSSCIDNDCTETEEDNVENSQNIEPPQLRRFYNGPRPSLYFGLGVASRAPVHTLPIKIYTKKTCIPFAEKAPRRLLANGIQDAFEDYGIIFNQY